MQNMDIHNSIMGIHNAVMDNCKKLRMSIRNYIFPYFNYVLSIRTDIQLWIQNYAHIIISIIQIMNIHVSIIDIHIRARTLDAARPSDGPFVLYDWSSLFRHRWQVHWNTNVFILMIFSSLAALEVVKLTTSSAAIDENFIKMTTFSFQCTEQKIKPLKHTIKSNHTAIKTVCIDIEYRNKTG